MSQAESMASHWVLLFFLGLLNKFVLVWSLNYAHAERGTRTGDHLLRVWSDWNEWSVCSRTCGGGVRMRTRMCQLKVNRNGNSYSSCPGENVEYELCSRHNCSPYDEEFLEYQCSLKNGQSIGGKKIEEWIPYRYGKNECELQCLSKDGSIMYSFGKAIDGTKCSVADSKQPAICVNGRCTSVDCAGLIGLDNRLDKCGVCRGDNSTCVHHQYTFWRRPRYKIMLDDSKDYHYDYEKITTIPAGSTFIFIEEDSETNFLALTDNKNNYVVNGNWRIQTPGRFLSHGSEFFYNRTWDGKDTLAAPGPLRFDVNIFVLGSGDIPTVRYEYWISSNNHFRRQAPPFHSLSQVKEMDTGDKKLSSTRHSLSVENNHIYDTLPSKKQAIPTISQGYKSYYHRNEILKSVPSWSIKRHRYHKNHLNRYISPTNEISYTYAHLNNKTSDKKLYNDQFFKPAFSPIETTTAANERYHSSRNVDLGNIQSEHSKSIWHKATTNSESKKTTGNVTLNIWYPTRTSRYHQVAISDSNSKESSPMPNQSEWEYSRTLQTTKNSAFRTTFPPTSKQHTPLNEVTSSYGRPDYTMAQTRSGVSNVRSSTPTQSKSSGKMKNKNKQHLTQKSSQDKASSTEVKQCSRKKKSNNDCLPCTKSKEQTRNFCLSDFVLRGVVLSSEKQENSIRYELEISQSFKNKVPISPKEYVWTTNQCRCPKLRNGREYIIMGHSGTSSNKRESRLLIERDSFVKKYSQKKAKTILRLVRNQYEICKKFEK